MRHNGDLPSSFRTVLTGVDFTERTRVALESAARFADLVGAERLHLVHAVQPWSWPGPIAIEPTFEETREKMIALAREELDEVVVPPVRAQVTRETSGGPATRELLRAATLCSADAIVAATAGLGAIKRALLGSVANGLIRTAKCPILIVGDDRPFVAPKRIIAAIELAPIAGKVLRTAAELADRAGAELIVLSAHDFERALAIQRKTGAPLHIEALPRTYREAIVDRVERELGSARRRPRIEVIAGDPPARMILEKIASERAELIVLGTSGHNAWRRAVLGSTASRIAAESPCAVLIVPVDEDAGAD